MTQKFSIILEQKHGFWVISIPKYMIYGDGSLIGLRPM
jgi:hypothetical protein